MSELTASQCGCGERKHCDCDNGCNGIIWIILILCLCNGGSGSSFLGWGNHGCDSDGDNGCCGIIILLLILSCCCGGTSIF